MSTEAFAAVLLRVRAAMWPACAPLFDLYQYEAHAPCTWQC